MKIRGLGLFFGVLLFSTVVRAESITPQEVDKAQAEMLKRIEANIKKYAARIGLDPWYISYCRGKMDIEIALYPQNGSIPFGVNYRTISDSERLELVLSNREAFETGYLQLCLANAKSTLSAAEDN